MNLVSLTARVGSTTIFRVSSFGLVVRRLLASGRGCFFRALDTRYSAAASFQIARRLPPILPDWLSMLTTGAKPLRSSGLFSRLYAGQDACCEKSNLFFRPVVNLVIPIAVVAAVVCVSVLFRSFGLLFSHVEQPSGSERQGVVKA